MSLDDAEWTGRPVNRVRTGPRGGAPVVLVHPVGLDLGYWDRQIEVLCDANDVVALDLPGHGRTPGGPSDWTLSKAAGCLEQVIRELDAGPVQLVGLSVGGMIAQSLALARPERVRSLILIDTAAGFAEPARAAMRDRASAARQGGMRAVLRSTIERWFTAETATRRPDLIERVSRTLLADDPLVHAAMWDMIAALDLVPELHRIGCPTMILVGEHDPSSPPAAARVLQAGIRRAEMHVIAAASHMAPLEKPEAVNAHLIRYLRENSGSAVERSPAFREAGAPTL